MSLDNFLTGLNSQNEKAADLNRSLSSAITQNPEEMARYNRLARVTGFDPEAIYSDPQVRAEAERRDVLAPVNVDALLNTHPLTAHWLSDPKSAALAHDDIGGMQALEDAYSYLWRSLSSGVNAVGATALDLAQVAGSATGVLTSQAEAEVLYKNDPEGLRKFREESPAFALGRAARKFQEVSSGVMSAMPESAKDRYALEYATTDTEKAAYLSPVKVVSDAIRSLPTTAALAATVYFTKGAAARAETAALVEAEKIGLSGAAKEEFVRQASKQAAEKAATITGAGGEGLVGYSMQKLQTEEELGKADLSKSPRYLELLESGLDAEAAKAQTIRETSEQAGVMAGLVDAAVNAAAGKFIADLFTSKKGVARATAGGVAVEGATEGIQSPGEQLASNLAIRENVDPTRDLLKGTGEAAVQGLFVGGLTGGAVSGLSAWMDTSERNAQQVLRSEQAFNGITKLSQAATATKLRERDPVAFKEFMKNMAEDSDLKEVFIDGSKLQEVLAQSPVEVQQQFAQDMPEVVAQIAEAAAIDGTVRVPVEDYATHIAGTEIDAVVLPHLKADVEGLTYAQAQTESAAAKEQMQAEAEQVLEANKADEEYQADAQQVYDTLLTRIEGAKRFTPDANKKYAALQQAYFITRAKKLGVKPSELLARFNLQVQAERTGAVGELEQVSPEQALQTNVPLELPTDPAFAEAVGNTPGAEITKEGLLIDLVRYQKQEQEGALAVRTGVFYLPVGSPAAKHYRNKGTLASGNPYGGDEKFQGQTLLRRPLFVKGATGGKAPEVAYDTLKGKGAQAKMAVDVRNAISGFGADSKQKVENVREILKRYGAEPSLAGHIVNNSRQGNQLFYAVQENIIAHAVREAGHDAVVGYSKAKVGNRISEVFDVREQTFPSQWNESDVHDKYMQSPSSDYGYRARDKARKATLDDFAPGKVQDLLRKTDWAILTAENPNAEALSEEENAARNAELEADLKKMGVEYTKAQGKYGGMENSFVITGITRAQAMELGEEFGQESVLTRDGLVYRDGTVNPARAVNTFETAPDDFYTTLPNGAMFSIDIDFDRKIDLTPDRIGEVRVEAVHFSQAPRTALSGRMYGTGIKGAEARRLADPNAHPSIKERISFYVDEGHGVRPEVGVGTFRHGLTLTNIYDGAKNPLRLPRDPNTFEKAVLDAGFDGYYIKEGFGNQGVGVVLGRASKNLEVDTPPALAYSEANNKTLFQAANEVAENEAPTGKLSPQDLADLRKLWTMYAAGEDSAQYGASQAQATGDSAPELRKAMETTLGDVLMGRVEVAVKDITHWHEGTSRLPSGGRAFEIISGNRGAAVYLDMATRSIQIDIMRWQEGGGGSGVYKAVLEFAKNNNFVFHGDSQGISTAAIKRRLENLLSHAIQTGETKHMALHPSQLKFIEQETGVPLLWKDGDNKNNVEQMLNASYNLANLDIPEIKNVYFDFAQNLYTDSRSGESVASVERYVAKARRNPDAVRREGAPGASTVARTILSNTLLRARTPEARRGVFAGMARFALDGLPGAQPLLYQSAAGGEFGVYPAGGEDSHGALATKAKTAKKLKLKTVAHKEGLRFVTATLEKVGERELPETILTTADAANATAYLGRAAVEHFDAIVTDKKGKVLAVVGSFKGAVAQASVYPATLVQEIASIEGAASVWASHNHPSGRAELSRSDELLSERIAKLLEYSATGIVYRGVLAIAGKEYISSTNENGTIAKPSGRMVKAPVAERMISGEGAESMAINSPRAAKAVVAELAKEPGILFLSHQYHPVSFAPFDPLKMGELRSRGRLMELFRAAASTGAGAAIISNPEESITAYQYNNLAAALKAIDIPVIDVITRQSDGVVASEAERGRLAPPDVFQQKNRGTFNPDTLTISLLKDADLTTFLHETGHFFLENEAALASDPNSPQELRDDFLKTLNWLGIADLATWQSMPFEQKRNFHEKFARGFESYLFEGKAPSNSLREVFASFKAWLMHVYRSITNLNVELTDEVRGVFDRMLAADEEIDAMHQHRAMKAAMLEGMSPEEKAAYLALDGDSADSAKDELERRSLRDMQWLTNARSTVLKKLQREQASKRKEVRAEVTAEVMAEPINKARTFLRKGEMTDDATGDLVKAEKGFRLNTGLVAEMYPTTMLSRPDLSKLRGMTASDGLHPDLIADMFGLRSGDALIRELIDGENPREKIEGITDQRMLERYGDLYDQQAIERAADEAVHNEARAKFMATGLKALTKSKLPVSQLVKAATDAAEETIAAKKIRDLHPKKYQAAETRANKEVLKTAAKKPEEAKRAQRSALLNNRLSKAALDALEDVRKGVDRMNKVQKAAAQANMRGEYLTQLNALLDRFDLRKSKSLTEIDRERAPLTTWLSEESERLSAVMPDLPTWVLDETNRKHYKELTVEEFRGLTDVVKQLEMLARREQNQYQAIRGMKFEAERTALLDRIREFHPEAFSLDGEPLGMSPKFVKHLGDTVKDLGDKFAGEFLNAETIVNLLEGGEFGIAHESLIGRMSKQADWKATRLGEIYQQMAPLFARYTVKERYDFGRRDIGAPIGMSLTRENALVVALLHGNADGRERLANYGWPVGRQQQIIDLLDERDMELAQGIWDLFDNQLWPELKALNDRTRGKSPPKVEAVEVEHKGRKYRGGYFRLKYDTNLDERAQRLDEGAAVKELLGGGLGMSAKTNQGSSTERKQNVTMRPRLDMGVFSEAVTETVHDLAYREAVADTMRMLNDVKVQNTIKTAAGTPAYRALVTRVREIAAPPRNPSGFIEKTLTVARKNTIVTLMSGVNTALQNFTGFVSASARVNPGRLAKEIALFYSPKMASRYEFALSQSEYMRNRHNAWERDLQNEIKKLTVNANILPETGTFLALMGFVDKGTSVPVWNAAFSEGMAKFENDKSKAVDYADHVVRQSQGSGRELDVAQIMSGHGGYGQLKRVFTMFYSYFNAQLGMLVRSGAVSARLAKTNPGLAAARFTKDFMLVFVLPAVLTTMIFKKGGEDDDPEDWMHKYGHSLAMYGMAMIPLVRDVGSFAWASFDHDVPNYGLKLTPVQAAAEGVVKGAVAVGDIAEGEGDDKDLKNVIMGTSFAVGLPGKLISDITLGTQAWWAGEAGPEAILFGPPKK